MKKRSLTFDEYVEMKKLYPVGFDLFFGWYEAWKSDYNLVSDFTEWCAPFQKGIILDFIEDLQETNPEDNFEYNTKISLSFNLMITIAKLS